MGRHTPEEIYAIAERDLRAVSDVLGTNDFLFGTSPCVTDASVFALVANFAWDLSESPQGKLIRTELTNLERHANRMKEMFFPDWEEIIDSKQLKEAEIKSWVSPTLFFVFRFKWIWSMSNTYYHDN